MKPRKVIPDTRNQIDDFVCDQIRALGYEVVRDKKNCYKLAWGDFQTRGKSLMFLPSYRKKTQIASKFPVFRENYRGFDCHRPKGC